MCMNAIILVVVAVLATTQAESTWYNQPEWSFNTIIGNDIELHCNDSELLVVSGDKVTWQSPSGMMLKSGSKYLLKDSDRVNDMILTVKDVQEEDKGVYLCWIYREDKLYTKANRALNLFEPNYRSNIDKYRYNITVGCVSAAIMFGVLCVVCIVHKCRYRSEEDKLEKKNRHEYAHACQETGDIPLKYNSGIENSGYKDSTKL